MRARVLAMVLAVVVVGCDTEGEVKSVQPVAPPPPMPAMKMDAPKTPVPTPKPPDASDKTIAPGMRVGPITRTTDRARLAAIYSEKALSDTTVTLEDGSREVATRIKLGPADSATVIWWDANREKVKEIRGMGKGWHTPEGVGIGANIETLEAAMGTFKVYGFGWDYAGTVNLEGTRYSRYRDRLFIRMAPTIRYGSAFTAASGDRQYSSQEKEMRAVKPIVAEMIVSLEPLPDEGLY